MKKLLLICLPVVLFSFATVQPEAHRKNQVQGLRPLDLSDWMISQEVFERMDQFNKNCRGQGCKGFKLPKKRNKEVREELRKIYVILNEQTLVGRYTEEDAPRYRRARGIADDDEAGDVVGYPTIITRYEVKPRNGADGWLMRQSRVVYTDEYSICPPPVGPGCD